MSSPVTIQQTAKKWKAVIAIGTVIYLIGFAVLLYGAYEMYSDGLPSADGLYELIRRASDSHVATGAAIAVVGILIDGAGRLMQWWHHK